LNLNLGLTQIDDSVTVELVLIFGYYTYYGLGAAVTASAVMILVSITLMIVLRAVKRNNPPE
jgi:ABC-type sulfate transport system permease component